MRVLQTRGEGGWEKRGCGGKAGREEGWVRKSRKGGGETGEEGEGEKESRWCEGKVTCALVDKHAQEGESVTLSMYTCEHVQSHAGGY